MEMGVFIPKMARESENHLVMGKNLQYFGVYTFKSNPAENVFIFWAMNKICQKSQKWNTKGIDKKFNDSLLH